MGLEALVEPGFRGQLSSWDQPERSEPPAQEVPDSADSDKADWKPVNGLWPDSFRIRRLRASTIGPSAPDGPV